MVTVYSKEWKQIKMKQGKKPIGGIWGYNKGRVSIALTPGSQDVLLSWYQCVTASTDYGQPRKLTEASMLEFLLG